MILKTKDSLKIVSNYGITGNVLPDNQFSVAFPYWDETFPSYSHFCKKYGMSPMCLIERKELYGKDLFLIANSNKQNAVSSTLDKEIELNSNLAISLARWNMSATFRVTFYLNATYHNLVSMLKAYIEVASEFSRYLAIPNPLHKHLEEKDSFLPNSKLPIKWIRSIPVEKVTMSNFASGDAIFFDMIGYLSSARSLLDSLVRVLKNRSSIGLPKAVISKHSFDKLNKNLENCKMPDNLKNFLIRNAYWTSELKNYRDCLLHYEILSRSYLPSVMVVHSKDRVIALFVWLPDNPETRSVRRFSFDKNIDYLGYAHSTYLKLVDLCYYILKDTYSEMSL